METLLRIRQEAKGFIQTKRIRQQQEIQDFLKLESSFTQQIEPVSDDRHSAASEALRRHEELEKTLRVRLEEASQRIDSLEREVRQAHGERDKGKVVADQLRTELAQVQLEKGELRNEYEAKVGALTKRIKSMERREKLLEQRGSNREDREEIARLKLENDDLKEKLKRSGTKLKLTTERMNGRISELEQTITERDDEIAALERARVESSLHPPTLLSKLAIEESRFEPAEPESSIDQFPIDRDTGDEMPLSLRARLDEIRANTEQGSKLLNPSVPSVIPTSIVPPERKHTRDVVSPATVGMYLEEYQRALAFFPSVDFEASIPRMDELMRESLHDIQPRWEPERALGETLAGERSIDGGKIERIFSSGRRAYKFANGTVKDIEPGTATLVFFSNGDVKKSYDVSGKVSYYYADVGTTHITLKDGTQLYRFANGQLEKHTENGNQEIFFPDGTYKLIEASGHEKSVFTDGTVQLLQPDGTRFVQFANGQKELYFPDGIKQRQHVDGTIKIIYTDKTAETLYPDGQKRRSEGGHSIKKSSK